MTFGASLGVEITLRRWATPIATDTKVSVLTMLKIKRVITSIMAPAVAEKNNTF